MGAATARTIRFAGAALAALVATSCGSPGRMPRQEDAAMTRGAAPSVEASDVVAQAGGGGGGM